MTLTLKVGKRYVRRDGSISHRIKEMNDPCFPFCDGANTLTKSGHSWHGEESDFDLLREYKPAKPEWRVVIKCESRENARHFAAYLRSRVINTKLITVEKSS